MAKDWSREQLLVGCSGAHVNVWSPFEQGANGLVYEATLNSVIHAVRWSPNRKALAYCDAAGIVHIASNGQVFPNTMATFEGGITCVRFSTDGKLLFISSKAVVHVLDLKLQGAELTFSDHTAAISGFCIDASDELMASASMDGTVMMHSLKEKRLLGQLCGPDGLSKHGLAMATHGGHATVVASSSKGIAVMNVVAGGGGGLHQAMLPSMHSGAVTGLAFSGASSLISCGDDGNVLVWDMRTQRVSTRTSLTAPLTCLAVRDEDCRVAVGTSDGTVHMIDFRMPEPYPHQQVGRFRGLPGPVTDLHWQPSARSHSTSSAGAAALRASAPAGAYTTGHAASAAGPETPAPLAGVPVSATAAAAAASAGPGRTVAARAVAGPCSNIPSAITSHPQIQPLRDATNVQPSHLVVSKPKRASDQNIISAGSKAPTSAASLWTKGGSPLQLPGTAQGIATSTLAAAGPRGAAFVAGAMGPAPSTAPDSPAFNDLEHERVCPASRPKGWASGQSAAAPSSASMLREDAALNDATQSAGARDILQSLVDDAMGQVRQDVRNLHIEVLRQAHLQQVELHQMLGKVLTNQDGLKSKIAVLEKRVEQLATKRHGAALGIF